MDVVRLNSTTYAVEKILDGFSSKIWTERYQDPGEFELRSYNIERTLYDLPEASLLSLRDSTQVMMVETHSIEQDGEGYVLVTKGRSAECILESRVFSDAKYGKKIPMQKKYSIQNALMVYLWNAVANTLGKSVVVKGKPAESIYDRIPNIKITDSTAGAGKAVTRRLENSDCYTQMKFWIDAGHFGIRMIRPISGAPSRKTAHVTQGGTLTLPLEVATGITMDIYSGVDRTTLQAARPAVIFSDAADDVSNKSYLFSSKDYKNVAVVISAHGPLHGKIVTPPAAAERDNPPPIIPPPVGGATIGDPVFVAANATPSGWSRRDLLVDAGTKDDGETTKEFLADLTDVGQEALTAPEHSRQSVFDGVISPNTMYKYNVDYSLGDKVTLLGKYGVAKAMQVQEYVRTENATEGENGAPGLALWT